MWYWTIRSRASSRLVSGDTVRGAADIQWAIASRGAPMSCEIARTMSRSVRIPANSSPSRMRTEPTRFWDITLAASARLEPDDIVTNSALIALATVVNQTTSLVDRYNTPGRRVGFRRRAPETHHTYPRR